MYNGDNIPKIKKIKITDLTKEKVIDNGNNHFKQPKSMHF